MFKLIDNYMLNIYELKKNNIKKNTIIKDEGLYVKDTKYQPAYSREWSNSIYAFNKNSVKSLPSTDSYVYKLIKSHFNLFNKDLEIKAKIYTTRLTNRVYKVNKIFVGKPEFKHTNDKVIITLFVYNQELINYVNKIKKVNPFVLKSNKNEGKSTIKIMLHMIKYLCIKFLNKVNIINNKYLSAKDNNKLDLNNDSIWNLIDRMLPEMKLYLHFRKLIHLNKSKFNSKHIVFLRNLLIKIYGKNVEFNIVNLKHYSLNSSILTQILGTKLKNRKIRPSYIMNDIVKDINLPYHRLLAIPYKISNKSIKQNLIVRNIINSNYTKKIPLIHLPNDEKILSKHGLNKLLIRKLNDDKLNTYLSIIYPKQYSVNLNNKKEIFIKPRNLENTVLDNIKNKVISGIRLESKGRLTRRVMGRSVSFLKYKGTIKNVYSSYKGVSSVLLRGNINYNVDLSKSNYKGALGSFGIKGWISGI